MRMLAEQKLCMGDGSKAKGWSLAEGCSVRTEVARSGTRVGEPMPPLSDTISSDRRLDCSNIVRPVKRAVGDSSAPLD
jgi:hypothetical protein